MKATASRTASRTSSPSRRQFLVRGGLAAATVALVPAGVIGRGGETAPNSRLNLAFVGVGAQGLRVMLGFLKFTDVQAVAVCDVNRESGDYPEWGRNEFRNSVRQLLGTEYASWGEWLSTERVIQLTRTMKVTGGTAGREPARKIVDAYYASQKRSGAGRSCAAYADFRELLTKENDVDAVVVGTPDHAHAIVSVAAMKQGKHVYCQKPMTRTIHEARRMAEVARTTGRATQVAVGNAASEATRLLTEWIAAGAIGPVHEVVNWSSRPFWPQGLERPTETPPVPEGLEWDLWLGPSPARPYHPAYLPFIWRGWYDFGCGAIGDMGCYSFDTIFRALQLGAPATVEASSSELLAETYPKASLLRFGFPARGAAPPVKLTWYDGGLRPARPAELDAGQKLAEEGLLFVGEKGSILCGFTGDNPRLIPDARMREFQAPPKSLPRSPGHEREWLDACRGAKTAPAANFDFSSRVTETILLGNVALRTGTRLEWDSATMQAANVPAAQALIQPEYRAGWTL